MAKLQMSMLQTNIDVCIEADKRKVESLCRKLNTVAVNLPVRSLPGQLSDGHGKSHSCVNQRPLVFTSLVDARMGNFLPNVTDQHVSQHHSKRRHRSVPNIGEEIRRTIRKRITLPQILHSDKKKRSIQSPRAMPIAKAPSPLPTLSANRRPPSANSHPTAHNTLVKGDGSGRSVPSQGISLPAAHPKPAVGNLTRSSDAERQTHDETTQDCQLPTVTKVRRCIVRLPTLNVTQEHDASSNEAADDC